MPYQKLIETAITAMKNSYSPYSNFKVGAALLCKNGNIYSGCNVENASFSATVCAERTAIFNAVSKGEKSFEAIAIVGGKDGEITSFCSPCGICRQTLEEFCNNDFKIILFDGQTSKTYTLGELLPLSFGSNDLCK